ncbi:MaoC family dehydratase [Streptomyces sp. RS10V-4]|uniref:MaoC family dehydratase n=1 Tax=Streptomyces rhizoryzae TaxID=2932493 RepID=UPI002005219C|nr:MaoC family dehydratase [Streptomyces rhizoryzae]MCK7623794.1 MaoC family dehydratase [Streptomyces rhizoryzae]
MAAHPTAGPPADGPPAAAVTRTYTVDRDRIARFVRALGGTPHPAHTDPAAARALGHPDVIAPPTYLAVLAAGAEDELLAGQPAFTADGAVHRAQSVRLARSVHAGETLRATVRVAGAADRAGRPQLTLECAFHTPDGTWVATTTSSLLGPATAGPDRRPLDPTGTEHP